MSPTFTFLSEQDHVGEKPEHAPPVKHEPLYHAQAEARQSSRRGETITDKDSGVIADKHVAPTAVLPVFLTPPPSIQPLIEPERIVEHDDVASQQPASLARPQSTSISLQAAVENRDVGQATMLDLPSLARRVQETPIRPLLDSLPPLTESESEMLPVAHLRSGAVHSPVIPVMSALPTLVAGQLLAVSERPGITLMLDEMGEVAELENADRRGQLEEKPRDEDDRVARGQTGSHAQQAPLDIWCDWLRHKTVAAKEEDEAQLIPLIRVNIGRVVVRGSMPAPPSPQKRVLRPAQSLNEYLKQRERGGR